MEIVRSVEEIAVDVGLTSEVIRPIAPVQEEGLEKGAVNDGGGDDSSANLLFRIQGDRTEALRFSCHHDSLLAVLATVVALFCYFYRLYCNSLSADIAATS